jgi:hypothetical protein
VHLLEELHKKRIVLASSSPRRKELLEGIVREFFFVLFAWSRGLHTFIVRRLTLAGAEDRGDSFHISRES